MQTPAGSETKVAFVSIRVGGVVGLNKYASEMLGRCDAVRVMYDRKRHRLGIVPGDPEAKDTYLIYYHDQVQVASQHPGIQSLGGNGNHGQHGVGRFLFAQRPSTRFCYT